MPFSISGLCPSTGQHLATRLRSASAAVLAMAWLAKGRTVIITDNSGRDYDVAEFRRRANREGMNKAF
jgi:hypothetical protein